MTKSLLLAALLAASHPLGVAAQDIVGLESCMSEKKIERQTGCLQSNVQYLQTLLTKNATEARAQLTAVRQDMSAANAEIAQLKAMTSALRTDIVRLEALLKAAAIKPEKK